MCLNANHSFNINSWKRFPLPNQTPIRNNKEHRIFQQESPQKSKPSTFFANKVKKGQLVGSPENGCHRRDKNKKRRKFLCAGYRQGFSSTAEARSECN
ncbi:hypothetical protein AVEN_152465-1 [Araneus ventricosus]|uniref:Uncharacterized protein n=1 Tax=Araneus ventricosus TaxID=182803 RepID=A0A4Y2NXA7_ARAVE|nr:hypothetical protein AVEN_152465-1 [Araneus ventricosus]